MKAARSWNIRLVKGEIGRKNLWKINLTEIPTIRCEVNQR